MDIGYLGLNEVDGDFYSGVNVTDDAASKIPISALAVFVEAALTPYLVAHLRSAQPRLSTRPAQVHQSTAFWQSQEAGPRSRMRAERSTEIEMKSHCFPAHTK